MFPRYFPSNVCSYPTFTSTLINMWFSFNYRHVYLCVSYRYGGYSLVWEKSFEENIIVSKKADDISITYNYSCVYVAVWRKIIVLHLYFKKNVFVNRWSFCVHSMCVLISTSQDTLRQKNIIKNKHRVILGGLPAVTCFNVQYKTSYINN